MSQVILNVQGTIVTQTLYGANEPSSTSQTFTGGTFAAVSVPSGSIGVLITPPDVSTGTITLKGVTGDTGYNIPQATPSFHSLDALGSSFGILCAGSCTLQFMWV